MIKRRGCPRLPLEPRQRRWIVANPVGRIFNATFRPGRMSSACNDPHAAYTQLVNDAVMGNRLSDQGGFASDDCAPRPPPEPAASPRLQRRCFHEVLGSLRKSAGSDFVPQGGVAGASRIEKAPLALLLLEAAVLTLVANVQSSIAIPSLSSRRSQAWPASSPRGWFPQKPQHLGGFLHAQAARKRSSTPRLFLGSIAARALRASSAPAS